jgi:glycosidase
VTTRCSRLASRTPVDEHVHPTWTDQRLGPRPEYREGDFFDSKDVHQGVGTVDDYAGSPALLKLITSYSYWIAFADLDGFRIDTVKHMDPGATRLICSAIKEFATMIGKDSFFLVGEITGGREFAFKLMQTTGLDAALGIGDVQDKLEYAVKGWADPQEYFALFRNSELVGQGSHTWFGQHVVTSYDDHDQVRKGDHKSRFAAAPEGPPLAAAALALNATTLGIPCVYYGSEQRSMAKVAMTATSARPCSAGHLARSAASTDTSSTRPRR